VVEGEVLEIEMQKVGEQQQIAKYAHFSAVDPIAETTEAEPTENSTGILNDKIMSPDRRYIPVTPDGARIQERRDREAYENGIFVPTKNSAVRQ
jgi:hypothetical protein